MDLRSSRLHPYETGDDILHCDTVGAGGDELISDQEKVDIIADFILHSPPGEINEVFNDIKILINNDILLKKGVSGAFPQYIKSQLTPVIIRNSGYPVLITEYNDLGDYRYFDSRSKQSFYYDHVKKEATDYNSWEPEPGTEQWRLPVQEMLDAYTSSYYKNGVSNVFTKKQGPAIILIACIEDHQFQPKNYWNGCWRSQWSVTINNGLAEIKGTLKIQIHYYEDGNVQLVSSKEFEDSIAVSSEEQTAMDLVKLIEEAESGYQNAIFNNYKTMSDTTFKALRRQLPVTRSRMDWDKLVSYNISKELKSQCS